MSLEQVNKNLSWDRWGSVAFASFCSSTIFVIFFSTSAIQKWSYPWNRLSILVACLFPLFLVIVWRIPSFFLDKRFEKQYLFVAIILILGMLNVIFSEDKPTTFKTMVVFLISGIGAFISANCLFRSQNRIKYFICLCWVCLVALCIYGTFEYFKKNGVHLLHAVEAINLLSYNPIPAGSLLIILFVGPFMLFQSSPTRLRILQILTILFAIVVIAMTGKRGPFLSLLAMAIFLVFAIEKKKIWVFALIALIMIATGYKMLDYFPKTIKKNLFTSRSTLFRLENYPFAAHIFLAKPLFGMGLHAPFNKYLEDYHQRFMKDWAHENRIKKGTLDNMILTGFVQMGSLFTITYIAWILLLLKNLFVYSRGQPDRKLKAILLLIPLFGFFVHSLTFDSLIYPHLNWLFHSFLGLMSNFNEL